MNLYMEVPRWARLAWDRGLPYPPSMGTLMKRINGLSRPLAGRLGTSTLLAAATALLTVSGTATTASAQATESPLGIAAA